MRIATASNARFVAEALAKDFEQQTGQPCEVIPGSSGKLYAQIKEGAPFQLFVAADLDYPQGLYDAGLTLGPPVEYARGQLAVWAANDSSLCAVDSLASIRVQRWAMANPEVAPYGRATRAALQAHPKWDKLKTKVVFAENIAQVGQLVSLQSVDVGITALSLIQGAPQPVRGFWRPHPPALYPPIRQGVVVLRGSTPELEKAALDFQRFLLAPENDSLFQQMGYLRQG
ncbi:MAG: molybdate ABC transporter substrate-binding protein [Salibacteraceae bacterium]